MSNINGYSFYFDDGSTVITLPITPGELSIKVGSNNDVVTLINEGEVNILKSPSLTEIEFDARFPMREYPYSKTHQDFKAYYDFFKELKTKKKSFRFIVARTTPNGKRTWDTNLLMALESMELNESADEGDDVIISFTLKQYKEYGVKTLPIDEYGVAKPVFGSNNRNTNGKNEYTTVYIVKSGDCLYNIAKDAYGNGAEWPTIYEANKTTIENTAKANGKSSSSNGHWIYPETKLTVPAADDTFKKSSLISGGRLTTSAAIRKDMMK